MSAYSDKVRFRARRQQKYQALRDRPNTTKDGVPIRLQINAGLPFDVAHLKETGADGIGLYLEVRMLKRQAVSPMANGLNGLRFALVTASATRLAVTI